MEKIVNFNFLELLALILLINGCAFPLAVRAQTKNLTLSTTVLDLGRIAANASPPKSVEFKNSSTEKLAILIIEKTPDILIRYPHKFYQPGEKGMLLIQYSPRNTGEFEETVKIYTNLDETPVSLKLIGTVVSVLECFPDPKNLLKRSIEVIDKDSREPVPNAGLSFVHNNRFDHPLNFRVDHEGKAIKELPIGLYHITAVAEGYEDHKEELFIPKSQPFVIIELSALRTPPPVLALEPVEEVPRPAAESPSLTVTSADLPENLYAANNLIFLLDVSTSMKSGGKFILLQQAVNNLVMILRPIDNISIISYSTEANTLLTGINGSDKDLILNSVQELHPYGITRGVKGLNKAYELAEQNFIRNGNNQIILMTDGEFSEKGISDSFYREMLSGYASKGINLSIVGFGINKEAIDRMRMMSEAGQGSFILVQSDNFKKEILIDEIKARSFLGN